MLLQLLLKVMPQSLPLLPKVMLPLMIPLEVFGQLMRLVSLSVRLFANMVAGHVMLKVFATFVVMMGGAGAIGMFGAAAPLACAAPRAGRRSAPGLPLHLRCQRRFEPSRHADSAPRSGRRDRAGRLVHQACARQSGRRV